MKPLVTDLSRYHYYHSAEDPGTYTTSTAHGFNRLDVIQSEDFNGSPTATVLYNGLPVLRTPTDLDNPPRIDEDAPEYDVVEDEEYRLIVPTSVSELETLTAFLETIGAVGSTDGEPPSTWVAENEPSNLPLVIAEFGGDDCRGKLIEFARLLHGTIDDD